MRGAVRGRPDGANARDDPQADDQLHYVGLAAAEQALGRSVAHEVVDRRPGDVARIWAGTNLAKRLLGWTASRGLTEMLVDHWRWQEAHPDGYGN